MIIDIAVVLVIIIVAVVAVLVVLPRLGTGPSESERVLARHAELMEKAAIAARKGHQGEANVLSEAADHLLEAWAKHTADQVPKIPRGGS